MEVAGFLQFIGFVLVAFVTAVAGFVIYVIHTGGRGLDDVIFRISQDLELSPETLMTIVVVVAWAIAAVPGFVLMANGLSTEAQLKQNEAAKKLSKNMDDIAAVLRDIRADLRNK